jgi:hypothetical protein
MSVTDLEQFKYEGLGCSVSCVPYIRSVAAFLSEWILLWLQVKYFLSPFTVDSENMIIHVW